MTKIEVGLDALPIIDPKRYWKLLGVRPVAVPVVAARDDDGPAGLLALSATHVTADPPSMLVALGKATRTLSTIKNSACFAINYLSEGEADTAEIFGGQRGIAGAARFVADDWNKLATGAPVYRKAAAVFDCIVDQIYEYHETNLVVGRLVAYSIDTERRPLILQSGKYAVRPF